MEPSEQNQAGALLGFFGVVAVLMAAPWLGVYWCARYPWARRVLAAIPFVVAAVVAIVWPRWDAAWPVMWSGTSDAMNWMVLLAFVATQVQLWLIVSLCRSKQVAGFAWRVAGALLVATVLEMVWAFMLVVVRDD